MRLFGGESKLLSKIVDCELLEGLCILKCRLELEGRVVGVGIGCDSGAVGSDWKRDLRSINWRGGRGALGLVGLGGVDS